MLIMVIVYRDIYHDLADIRQICEIKYTSHFCCADDDIAIFAKTASERWAGERNVRRQVDVL